MTIRHALASDVPEIVAMATTFHAQTPYRDQVRLDADRVAALVRHLIAHDDGAVFVAQGAGGDLVGMIVLHAFPHPFSGDRVASELAWWVEPVHRGRAGLYLLRRAEQWAQETGAVWWQMVAPTEEVGRFYEGQGFTALERTYQRRV